MEGSVRREGLGERGCPQSGSRTESEAVSGKACQPRPWGLGHPFCHLDCIAHFLCTNDPRCLSDQMLFTGEAAAFCVAYSPLVPWTQPRKPQLPVRKGPEQVRRGSEASPLGPDSVS